MTHFSHKIHPVIIDLYCALKGVMLNLSKCAVFLRNVRNLLVGLNCIYILKKEDSEQDIKGTSLSKYLNSFAITSVVDPSENTFFN